MLTSTQRGVLTLLVLSVIGQRVTAAEEVPNVSKYLELSGLAREQASLVRWVAETQDSQCPPMDFALRQEIDASIQPDHLAATYATAVHDVYSAEELTDLVTFYSSDLGRHLAEKRPGVEAKGSQAVERIVGFWRLELLTKSDQPLDLYLLTLLYQPREATSPGYSDAHRKAADALLEASGLANHFRIEIDEANARYGGLLDQQKKLPSAEQLRLKGLTAWDGAQRSFSKLILEAFSEGEAQGVLKFYSTSAGAKEAKTRDSLRQKLYEMSQDELYARAQLLRTKKGC